jgi:hypothetical protein
MGGIMRSRPAQQPVETVKEMAEPAAKAAAATADARVMGEEKAARRRARRGGRSLLSDSRLNPEQGVATLGQTGL